MGSSQELDEEQETTYRNNGQDGVYRRRHYRVEEITALEIVPGDFYAKPGKGQADESADNGSNDVESGLSFRV